MWLGGLVHGGSRFDGAMLGTLVGTLPEVVYLLMFVVLMALVFTS